MDHFGNANRYFALSIVAITNSRTTSAPWSTSFVKAGVNPPLSLPNIANGSNGALATNGGEAGQRSNGICQCDSQKRVLPLLPSIQFHPFSASKINDAPHFPRFCTPFVIHPTFSYFSFLNCCRNFTHRITAFYKKSFRTVDINVMYGNVYPVARTYHILMNTTRMPRNFVTELDPNTRA
jgi:hypothetical protein